MKRKARLSSCQIRDESSNHILQCGIVFCEDRMGFREELLL